MPSCASRAARDLAGGRPRAVERPGRPLVGAVPARLLTTGDYVLSIEGEALRGESRPSGPRSTGSASSAAAAEPGYFQSPIRWKAAQ